MDKAVMFGLFGSKKRPEFDLQEAFEEFVTCVGAPRGTDDAREVVLFAASLVIGTLIANRKAENTGLVDELAGPFCSHVETNFGSVFDTPPEEVRRLLSARMTGYLQLVDAARPDGSTSGLDDLNEQALKALAAAATARIFGEGAAPISARPILDLFLLHSRLAEELLQRERPSRIR
ncbi:hypothetical protein [Rhizobium leguminosarum]|uniref:hypothetical protein n=1 Tax=Rhizobium leguminosarum TaxID=384 RepID=UPI002E1299E7|nr:hypothetical protein U8Q02_41045 [Rhizobium leguminosarum]